MVTDLTSMLRQLPSGGGDAFDVLLSEVYQELRKLARGHLRHERQEHTLGATALVHEGWLRLVRQRDQRFENRAHFFGAVSRSMRRILVDHARSRSTRKRHAERIGLTAAGEVADVSPSSDELVAIDAALQRLAAINERMVRVVECRYFAGLTIPETAETLGISQATVSEDWRFARAWLRRELSTESGQVAS